MAGKETRPIAGDLGWNALIEVVGPDAAGPFHLRLTNAIREAIRTGRLPAGSVLPPSRQLAAELRCSRWTVTEAYDQLVAEGYLEAKVGSSTRVRVQEHGQARARTVAPKSAAPARFDLRPGTADLRAFPRAAWARIMREVVANMPWSDLNYPQPGGHPRLRQVLADYLHRVRGADVDADDITVTSGILDGIGRVAHALSTAGHKTIAVENPSWPRVFDGIRRNGLEVVPVPIDGDGMAVSERHFRGTRAALVAPAHQFPVGAILSPSRRAALLDWVQRSGGLILEDDYDAEFRYDRRPVGALQGIAPHQVALFGSLSKTLAPGVGLGWAITPARWTAVVRATDASVTGPSTLEQLALAKFIESGAYDRHLRLARRRYRSRRDRLTYALARDLPDCKVLGAEAGLHFLLRLPRGIATRDVVTAASEHGMPLAALASYFLDRDDRAEEGLVIGYGNLADELVDEAAKVLVSAIKSAGGRLS